MQSDSTPRRLHPSTIFFSLVDYLKAFGVPVILLMLGYSSGDHGWRLWSAALIVPVAIGAIAHYLSFTYTYGDEELIVRSGILFKKERHVPYSRIQNVDATQGVLQGLVGVYNVSLESGSGAEAEATLTVVAEDALNEMRRRIFADRGAPEAASDPAVSPEPAVLPAAFRPVVLLDLGLRDLAVCGLIKGRGLLMLAAILGLFSQYELADDADSDDKTGGPIYRGINALYDGGVPDAGQLLVGVVLFVLIMILLRLASMLHTMQMFHGFRLLLSGGELRLSFGLLTRIKATIPLGRIQTITIRENALHRLFGVSSVRAATAGGHGMVPAGSRYLAPIIPRADVAALVRVLMPGADIDTIAWQPAHPRAFRRLLARHAGTALIVSSASLWIAGAWSALILAVLLAAAFAHARLQARHMGHSLAGGIFAFRSGWYMRQTTITPLRKVQAVAVSESPFDRRHGMAGLAVDTASAAAAPHRLRVPYLGRDDAHALHHVIAAGAMQSTLSW
ncbi:MAG: PH domain-containing protein [Acidobacteriota bacterium]|nr:PH domain-containing protein [Acidobacteriota bacterium]